VIAVDVKEIIVVELLDETLYEEVVVVFVADDEEINVVELLNELTDDEAVVIFVGIKEELYVAVELLDGPVNVVIVGVIEVIVDVILLNELTDDEPVVFVGIDEEINVEDVEEINCAVELVEDEAELIKGVIEGEAEIAMV